MFLRCYLILNTAFRHIVAITVFTLNDNNFIVFRWVFRFKTPMTISAIRTRRFIVQAQGVAPHRTAYLNIRLNALLLRVLVYRQCNVKP